MGETEVDVVLETGALAEQRLQVEAPAGPGVADLPNAVLELGAGFPGGHGAGRLPLQLPQELEEGGVDGRVAGVVGGVPPLETAAGAGAAAVVPGRAGRLLAVAATGVDVGHPLPNPLGRGRAVGRQA